MSAGINHVCRSCRLLRPTSAAVRTFTSSSTRGAIPPESPNYVDIPGTFQTDFFPPQRQKGILPVPREIFPARQPDKPSQQYLSRAIPPRKKAPSKPLSKMTEEEKYQARMTDLRRQHLRSGLLELYNRKQVMTAQMSSRSTARQKERARLMTQPPREDERLTNTSIHSSMLLTPGNSSTTHDPATRAAIHARKLANVAGQTAAKTESRRDALHTLYMHARTFITTEKQLAAELDLIFDKPWTEWGTAATAGSNIWNREPPATIAALLQDDSAGGGRQETGIAVQRGNRMRYRLDQQRMKRIAEALSGGKM
ncbi:hypothetical protein GJ744_007823 [Endocarpon pusillum]|uniref:Uncharacterized protein n=1 Tax=Endocarpon pusillum TaxID=364733 RepID=A0A8H7AVN3_9EURO|nr:hypothetical protein GJ744_007823 [Endocarpon pusillum]